VLERCECIIQYFRPRLWYGWCSARVPVVRRVPGLENCCSGYLGRVRVYRGIIGGYDIGGTV